MESPLLKIGVCNGSPIVFLELFSSPIGELLPIICYHAVRESMPAYDMFPKKILYLASCDGDDRLRFYPFGKVVNCHYEEFYLPFCQREWTQYVYPRSAERPRRDGLVQFFGRRVENGLESLAFGTLVRIRSGVLFDCWPVIPGPQNSHCHGSRSRMYLANSFVQLCQHVVSLCKF